jgi:hypothetical protein
LVLVAEDVSGRVARKHQGPPLRFFHEGLQEKYLSTKYTQGEGDKSSEEVCKAQHFNPAYGFDAEWGFPPGMSAKSILDWVSRVQTQ